MGRLGTWCHDRRWLVLILWIVGLVVANGVANGIGNDFRQDFTLNGFESTKGFDLVQENFDDTGGSAFAGQIVFQAEGEQGVDDAQVKDTMTAYFDEVAGLDGVTSVQSPYTDEGQFQISQDGTVAFAVVNLPDEMTQTEVADLSSEIRDRLPEEDGLRIELGGYALAEYETPTTEAVGLAFAIIILIVAFGSVLAMGLPIGVAIFGIMMGGALVTLASRFMEVPEFAPFIGVMIGLGVGIDYALLIVTRYREQVHAGHDVRESVGIALDTAGRATVFAGATVVISLLGMVMMGVGFVSGLGISASLTVLATVAASITLLPALIGFAGANIERTRWRGLIASGFVALMFLGYGLDIAPLMGLGSVGAVVTILLGFLVPPLKREVHHRPPKPRRQTAAYRWSRVIQHRPWPFAIGAALFLVVLALPVFGLRLGFNDESNFADDTTTKQAYDLIVDGFGEGFTGPVFLVASVDSPDQLGELDAVQAAVAADPDVVNVSPADPNDRENPENATAVRWQVTPVEGPQDESTTNLVNRLRDDVLPPIEDAAGTQVFVTGAVASNVDMSALLQERMPWFFGAVLTLSFLLLMLVFRSLLVPLKAVIMNLLSIGAAYGIMIAVFQWGWLSDITGVEPGPIEAWVPMMLFAIVFGLSMDYEVFLLSRVREEWIRTGDSRTSVADGLAATAKVITAAAAIMVVVFGSFVLEFDRVTKMMGVGLATAIFLDATIVRMVLVPATMELLGDRNWWLPKWIDRILPHVAVEGHVEDAAPIDDTDPDEEKELVGASD